MRGIEELGSDDEQECEGISGRREELSDGIAAPARSELELGAKGLR